MEFGGISLTYGIMLAPMAGVTDRAMRRVSAEHGAEYAVTEMVSAKALVYEQLGRPAAPVRTADLCVIEDGIPTAVQLFGAEPEFIREAARLVSRGEYRGFRGSLPAAVDLNMGCPVRKVVSCGEGSALMKDPEKIYEIVRAAAEGSAVPVTVKLRAGWDAEHKNAADCAAAAEAAGAAAVCVHARTREQFYTPGTDPAVIGEVVSRVSIPVFGNGDLQSGADALRLRAQTGCAGVAVARAAMGNPFVFADIRAALSGGEAFSPTPEEVVGAARRLLELAIADKGERRAVAEHKVTISHCVRGLRGAAQARNQITGAVTSAQIISALESILQFTAGEDAP